ncbi:ferredoxin--NADP reductase, root isozyme 2, chloroplastic-like [Dioscorea cayenensis subsp. rotundata]|uniref:ferredoxin--NADP(+) reductase n=1 Tax=Dioscorea cayennensis subsp. rotundata TaxID=55577 RepID=A0AB40C599_DIOCR|nr:ferredoxin--NADP reductase, root isozyme 2, chloroplastic-like [Dioscorea cayenensis subsp. rotundata]
MALMADVCSVMQAKMLPVKGLGFNHSGSQIFSNLSFGNNAPTSLPCLSLRKEKQQYSNYNHNVIRIFTQQQLSQWRLLLAPKGEIGEVCHIVLDHGGSFSFKEGQYLLVHFQSIKRYFSIASGSSGDTFDGKTLSLCVRRAELSPDSVSNFLCNVKAGDTVDISGPFGGQMVFDEERKMHSKHIMVATATGVAPFRSNIQGIFLSNILGNTDNIWLISGADNYNSLLYDKEFIQVQNNNSDRFRYQRALNNSVDDVIYQSGDEIFKLLETGAYIYIAGSNTMLPGIKATFAKIAQERGVDWDEMLRELQSTNHWRVEVY